MFLRKQKRKNGKTNLSIIKGYWDPVSKNSRQKVVKNLGYLEDYYDLYDDPISHFEDLARRMTEEEKQNLSVKEFTFDLDESVTPSTNRKNLGFTVLSYFYHKLGIDEFWNNRQKTSGASFNLNKIFQALIYLRVLDPSSKRASVEALDDYFFDSDFALHDVYRALSIFAKYKDDFLIFLHESILLEYGRDTSKVFYDVTNYYFEIDYEDDLRVKGMSKEHRPSPIVQMGLLMDNNAIPMSFGLFAGNTHDSKTFRPIVDKTKESFGLDRVVFVADKAMSSGNNIVYNSANGDGYIFSKSIRNADNELKGWVLDDDGYDALNDDFKIKSRVVPSQVNVRLKGGRLKRVQVDQKQVVYWSRKYADRQRYQRERAVAKAEGLIDKGITKPKSSSYDYIQTTFLDPETGEVLDDWAINEIDEEKVETQEMFDGYFLIVSSELDMDDFEIVEAYRNLAKIEESFKITKSTLEARPVYLSREDRILGHFLTCYVSLTILRLMELELNDKEISLNEAIDEMREITASHLKENYYLFDRNTELTRALGEIVGVDFTKRLRSLKEIKDIVAMVK